MRPTTPEELRETEAECDRMLGEARAEFKKMADEARADAPELRNLFASALRKLAAEILVMCEGLES